AKALASRVWPESLSSRARARAAVRDAGSAAASAAGSASGTMRLALLPSIIAREIATVLLTSTSSREKNPSGPPAGREDRLFFHAELGGLLPERSVVADRVAIPRRRQRSPTRQRMAVVCARRGCACGRLGPQGLVQALDDRDRRHRPARRLQA